MGLYEGAFGQDYEKLNVVLQEFHRSGVSAVGKLSVRHSGGRLGSMACRILRLPPSGEELATELAVEITDSGEVWRRRIGTYVLETYQYLRDGHLHEKAGPIAFRFDLTSVDQGMEFRSTKTYVVGIPMPRFLAMRIEADVKPRTDGWWVQVRFFLPPFGQICQYEGEMHPA